MQKCLQGPGSCQTRSTIHAETDYLAIWCPLLVMMLGSTKLGACPHNKQAGSSSPQKEFAFILCIFCAKCTCTGDGCSVYHSRTGTDSPMHISQENKHSTKCNAAKRLKLKRKSLRCSSLQRGIALRICVAAFICECEERHLYTSPAGWTTCGAD